MNNMYIPITDKCLPVNLKSIKDLNENECIRINSKRELEKLHSIYPRTTRESEKSIYFYPRKLKFYNKKQNPFHLVYFLEELKEFLVEEAPKKSEVSEFGTILNGIKDLLDYKNAKYGNSALEPLNIFSGKCKVGQRIDDKLARIKNAKRLRKNDLVDTIGYLVLVCKEQGWDNFEDLKD